MKKATLTAALALQMLAPTLQGTFAQDRIPLLDNVVITVNPKVKTTGPKFQDSANHKAYGEQIVSLILDEAHKRAKSYLEYGDFKAYYSFLILSLTVPLQEGLYIHFRDVANEKGLCDPYINEGQIIKDKNSKTTYDIFHKYLKTGPNAFIANCDNVAKEKRLTQMMRAGKDATDMGIMQVSLRWHYPEYFSKGKMSDVRKSIIYGLNHLWKGFRPIYAKANSYSCMKVDGKINYESLIRGTWAGQYNSGNLKEGSVCRFTNSESPYKMHDVYFKKNFDKVMSAAINGKIEVMEGFEVQLSGVYKDAMSELINNYQKAQNSRKSLSIVLATGQKL